MRKSGIVIAIVSHRSTEPMQETQIHTNIVSALISLKLRPEAWDEEVDNEIAQRVIKHISSVKGELSLEGIISDINLMLRRATRQ